MSILVLGLLKGPQDIRYWYFSTGVAALSRDRKRFVLTYDGGHRIFEYNNENRWVKIGKKIRGDESRVLGINDDGSRIAIQGQRDSLYVYELVPNENSDATCKQLGGDLGVESSLMATSEWEQVANGLSGGKHVKISADGNTVTVGRSTDLEYYYRLTPCCGNYVKFYKLWQGSDGEAYWDEVATIKSGPRQYFSYYMAATNSLDRMVVAARETYSVFDVTFSDDIGPCVDQEGASFSLINIDKEVGCDWLTKYGKDWVRRGKYCVESHDGGSVMKLCRKSCGICIP
ncbi:predicted protein [Chaetoceros tenuissimus]|uniref:Uncharacterized protein n=1 Tax=Chaetoceros tenuissimus TaxID=426638 RepID=A0AAD3DC79_9STRA|nr:predicted protein [Chaetoceros tenuissimus]